MWRARCNPLERLRGFLAASDVESAAVRTPRGSKDEHYSMYTLVRNYFNFKVDMAYDRRELPSQIVHSTRKRRQYKPSTFYTIYSVESHLTL